MLLAAVCLLNVALSQMTVLGVPVRIVKADLRDPQLMLDVVVPPGFPNTDEAFSNLAKGSDIVAAFNGAYFDKETKRPIGDIVIEGTLVYSGRMGTAFSVSDSGELDIERVVRHKTLRWAGKRTVFACGPALVLDGEVDVKFAEEGFRDPHVTGSAQRMAVGYTKDRTVLFAHIQKAVTFAKEAEIMKSLGCFEAMNLDAGASLAMAYRGKVLTSPSRRLVSVIVLRKY